MATLEFGERVPMPIEQTRKDFGFHFAFLELFIALFVTVIACRAGARRRRIAIRIYRGDKNDVLSVWRPNGAVGASGNRSDLMWLPNQLSCFGIEIAHPDLCRIGRFRRPNQA